MEASTEEAELILLRMDEFSSSYHQAYPNEDQSICKQGLFTKVALLNLVAKAVCHRQISTKSKSNEGTDQGAVFEIRAFCAVSLGARLHGMTRIEP